MTHGLNSNLDFHQILVFVYELILIRLELFDPLFQFHDATTHVLLKSS